MRHRATFAAPIPGVSAILRVPFGTRLHNFPMMEKRSRDFAKFATSALVATRVSVVDVISGQNHDTNVGIPSEFPNSLYALATILARISQVTVTDRHYKILAENRTRARPNS